MRETLFRGVTINGNSLVYGYFYMGLNGAYIIKTPYKKNKLGYMESHEYEIITNSLGQYTGLKDKN